MLSSISLKKYIRISLAGFMSVWLSGVVFLFCCEKINGKTSEVEFCPLAKMSSDDCPMAKEQNADAEVVETAQEDCVGCCAFLPVVFDKTRKIEQNQKQIATPANVVAVQFNPPGTVNFSPKPFVIYSRINYQNDLLVKNCVFRI